MSKERLEILYDGECLFCKAYIKHVKLQKNFDVVLINARESSTLKEEVSRHKYDLDHGMIVVHNGKIHFGSDAMYFLSLASTPSDTFNKLMIWIFKSEQRTRYLYPPLTVMRRIVLFLLNRKLIRNLHD